MKVVGLAKLEEFKQEHGDSQSQLDAWVREVSDAVWRTPQEIQARFVHARFPAENRAVFNINGSC